MIDKSGDLWKGDSYEDLCEYLLAFTAQNYRADELRRSVCVACGSSSFGISLDDDEGCAQRICCGCSARHFIADSEEYWDDADPGDAACPCGGETFEIGVAFSLIDRGEVRWITVGCRCLACGSLGVYVDWKVDYEPSRHLLELA